MNFRKLALVSCLLITLPAAARASETPTEHAANVAAQQAMYSSPMHGNLPDYSLAPDKLAKAQHLSKVRVVTHVAGTIWGLLQFVLLLWFGVVAWMRDRALAASAGLRETGKRGRAFWRECLVFTGLYTLISTLLGLPLSVYGHAISIENGLSVQGWGSWFADWGKGVALGLGTAILIYALLKFIIRRFPRRWWLVFWVVLAPIMLLVIYGTPLVIDPLFNKFEPLQKTNPELVAQLEKVVARGNMDIPPERMFLMKASAKVTTMNAYVTGFGGSKRVVVWDTSLQKGTTDEVLFIFGHESGHYVLGHVLRGILMVFFGLLAVLYVGYHFIHWSLARFGSRWRIPTQEDWGAIVVLLFAIALFEAVLEPVTNGISRVQEHAADVYGQEAIHGIVAEPQRAAQGAFQVLGENSLDEPNTPPLVELWMDNHPSTGRRAEFAAHYDPWAAGADPKYFSK